MLLLPLLLLQSAAAEPLFVAGARVAVGVAPDGSLCDASLELCLLWDPPGEAPMGADLLWPGSSYEVWAASWQGPGGVSTLENGAPYIGSDLSPTWSVASGPDVDVLVGIATTADADWELRIEVPWNGDVVWLTVTVAARATLTDLQIARMVDADPDWGWNGSHATTNTVGDGWAASAGAWDGRTLALASPGGEAHICHLCTSVGGLRAGTTVPDDDDRQIGVAVDVGTLEIGESATVRFAYGLAADVDSAVDLAVRAAANADHDFDGVDAPADCDDADADVFPGAIETTDRRDEDCDGQIDEDSAGVDDDGDGWAEVDGDCDDTDAAVFPGATPLEGALDADCDGVAEGAVSGLPDDMDQPDEVNGGCATHGGAAPVALRGAGLAFAALVLAAVRRDRRRA